MAHPVVLPSEVKTSRKMSLLTRLRREKSLLLMIMPAVIGFLLFSYFPIYGVIIAFQDYDPVFGFFDSDWVGFKHFINFFNDPYFGRIIRNTILLSFYKLLWAFAFPIVFALFLNELRSRIVKRTIQSISYLPHFLSMVVVVGLIQTLFGSNGPINALIHWLGGSNINFLVDPSWFRPMYISSAVWQQTGWDSIIYLAAMSSISSDLYEAVDMDGANRFQKMWHITLPGIRPTIIILLIFAVGHLVGVEFEKVYLLYSPATYSTADVLQTYVYRRGIVGGDFSYAAAIGLFNSVIALILIVTTNYLSKRLSSTSLW